MMDEMLEARMETNLVILMEAMMDVNLVILMGIMMAKMRACD